LLIFRKLVTKYMTPGYDVISYVIKVAIVTMVNGAR